jgi:hypothetical protein
MKTMKNARLEIGVARCCSLPQRPIIGAAVLLLALLGLSGTSGCTMCPDPFDYSGPVPNGSAPQNNFLARSNGILPLGASTKPWPPLVKSVVPTPPPAEVELVDALEVDALEVDALEVDEPVANDPTAIQDPTNTPSVALVPIETSK